MEKKKYDVELKQTAKGEWYVGNLHVESDTLEELDNLIKESSEKIMERVNLLNSVKNTTIVEKENEEIFLNESEINLFNKLRDIRKGIADSKGVPPYYIFHDSVLKNMAKKLPSTREEMLKIEGVGELKIENFGDLFLDEIREFVRMQNNNL